MHRAKNYWAQNTNYMLLNIRKYGVVIVQYTNLARVDAELNVILKLCSLERDVSGGVFVEYAQCNSSSDELTQGKTEKKLVFLPKECSLKYTPRDDLLVHKFDEAARPITALYTAVSQSLKLVQRQFKMAYTYPSNLSSDDSVDAWIRSHEDRQRGMYVSVNHS